MVMTPRIGSYFVEWPTAPDDRTLGVVDFSIFPHLDLFPQNTMADAERWAADINGPAYAIDEQTAIQVVDGTVEVDVRGGDGESSGRRRAAGSHRPLTRGGRAATRTCRGHVSITS
ncbi:hypothetical protein SALBM217S_00340 [Streptomyces griseoloalbus]